MSIESERGLIGMLITDRDQALVPQVFPCLSRSLDDLSEDTATTVDLALSLRPRDRRARAQAISHRPRRIDRLRFLETDYAAAWAGRHEETHYETICRQRNALRDLTLADGYDWLLFLDSDVEVRRDTLRRLLDAAGEVVHAPYRPRWSAHVVVGVAGAAGRVEILANPQRMDAAGEAFPCALVAAGCTLIRQPALDVPFAVADYGFVRGEDIGFCLQLKARGIVPRCLTRHHVEHLCQPWEKLLIPAGDAGPFRLDEEELVRRLRDAQEDEEASHRR